MLQNKEIDTAESYGRSWAHIRHILIENNKNEGKDMDNNKQSDCGYAERCAAGYLLGRVGQGSGIGTIRGFFLSRSGQDGNVRVGDIFQPGRTQLQLQHPYAV